MSVLYNAWDALEDVAKALGVNVDSFHSGFQIDYARLATACEEAIRELKDRK